MSPLPKGHNSSPKFTSVLSCAIAVATSAAFASWTASGTVKTSSGTAISGAVVSVKDSSYTATTDANGAFSITRTTGILSNLLPSDFFVHQEGTTLVVGVPSAEGFVHATLVNIAGASLWQADATLSQGIARLPFDLNSFHGPAILRVRNGAQSWTQPLTLAGSSVAISQRPASARALSLYPTLVAKKTGYADTTFAMTSSTQTGIAIVMRDSTSSPTSTTCTLPSSPSPGNGSFTEYYFSQGTTLTSYGYRQTACGYHGYEPNGTSSDTMQNIAYPQYFVAIPGVNDAGDFANVDKCGACVELYTSSGAVGVIATVTDECPKTYNNGAGKNQPCIDNFNGHLDISMAAISKLGYGDGYPKNTTWKYVPCPVRGTAVFRVKPGNANEFFIENTVMNIKSVVRTLSTGATSTATRTFYGAWHLDTDLKVGSTLTITDYAGRVITYKPTAVQQDVNYDMGKQFPTCSSYTN